MARKAVVRTIGAHTYRVRQFGATQGSQVFVKLIKLAGSGAEDGIKAIASAGGNEKIGALGALASVLSNLDPVAVSQLCSEFAESTDLIEKEGEREPTLARVFDDHFAGEYGELVSWLAFAIEVNYLRFFLDKLAPLLENQKAKPGESESKSPKV